MKNLPKKLLIAFLAIALMAALALFASAEGAPTIIDSGYCGGEGDGTNLTWTLKSNGLLTFSGKGTMVDYTFPEKAPWNSCSEEVTSVVIKTGVTSIGNWSFHYCAALESVTIGNSVSRIGDGAFYDCCALQNVTIPNSVTNIGYSSFSRCTALQSVTISNSVTSIGKWAFYGCDAMENISIPDSVTSIDHLAFDYCIALQSISVDTNNPSYSSDASGCLFNKDKTELIQYPTGNSRVSFTIPDSVKSIDDYAFSYCESLESVTIPNSVIKIGDSAFSDCTAMQSVSIPNSVTSIGSNTFFDCVALQSFTVDDSNAFYSSDASGCLFNKNKTELIQYPSGNSCTSFTIPNSVTSIDDSAFFYCTELQSVTIPNGVTSIGNGAFEACIALQSVIIPDSLKVIGNCAFSDCYALESITIGNGVLRIGDSAFSACTKLQSVAIPNSVTSIGEDAFFDCIALQSIMVDTSNSFYSSDATGCLYNKKKTELIQYPSGNLRTSFTIPDGVMIIGEFAFRSNCSALQSITIPSSVTNIAYSAFSGCISLTDVYFIGTRVQWGQILIGDENELLTDATIHFTETEPSIQPTTAADHAHSQSFFLLIIQWLRNLFAKLFGR